MGQSRELRLMYIGKVFCESAGDNDSTTNALATLGDVMQNKNDPICVALPKVAKASVPYFIEYSVHFFTFLH